MRISKKRSIVQSLRLNTLKLIAASSKINTSIKSMISTTLSGAPTFNVAERPWIDLLKAYFSIAQ